MATLAVNRARQNCCVEAAKGQGVSEADLQAEIGDVAEYIRDRLKSANKAASGRNRPGD
jgi:hypothetical protein